ncbi:MAG: YicC family protein [Bacteroidaceae bacterium]|nr:YicC family protein [Bacteroidaceae bacterium]
MIQSMTGYGKAVAVYGSKKIYAEIKSLNSKAMDLSTRIAPLYREKEMEIRNMITQVLERGKVDFNLWTEEDAATTATPINGELLNAYKEQLEAFSEEYHLPLSPITLLPSLLRLPDVLTKNETKTLEENEWAVVKAVVTEAIDKLVDFRKQEGAALEKKFNEKVDNIESLLHAIEPYEKERVENIRKRILDALEKKLGVDYDKNRFEQELIFYIEKLDINEEKQRLTNHLNYFRETMREGHGQGKKLGFIAQEMGREINTTGSKSNHAEMQNIVVKMKDELEQIKEQVLNVM